MERSDLTILYVEDDPELIVNVTFLLERYVKKVHAAINGQEALDMYFEHKPDILITDINLPKLSGLDLAEKVREDNKNIPILIITAYNEEKQLQRAEVIGVSSYVTKPFTLDTLKKAITKGIEEKKA